MNIYRCISEELLYHHHLLDDGTGPSEPYAIAELIVAEKRGRAKWLAWRTDSKFDSDIRDMPKFSVVMTRKGVDLPEGVIERPKPAWWSTAAELRKAWRERRGA